MSVVQCCSCGEPLLSSEIVCTSCGTLQPLPRDPLWLWLAIGAVIVAGLLTLIYLSNRYAP